MKTRIHDDISETIGDTPLVKLTRVVGDTRASVCAKLEYLNPCGSVKDRTVLAMIEALGVANLVLALQLRDHVSLSSYLDLLCQK